jgi:hypothetical protein
MNELKIPTPITPTKEAIFFKVIEAQNLFILRLAELIIKK